MIIQRRMHVCHVYTLGAITLFRLPVGSDGAMDTNDLGLNISEHKYCSVIVLFTHKNV